MIKILKTYTFIAILLLQILIIFWFYHSPEFVERYYTQGFYIYWSDWNRMLTSWCPFSIGDILYGVLIVFLVYILIQNRRQTIWRRLRQFFVFFVYFFFVFNILWGFNNYRIPIEDKMSLGYEYTISQLLSQTEILICQTNALQMRLTRDISKKVENPESIPEIFEKSVEAYKTLNKIYPEFVYKTPSVKVSLYSKILSYMGFSGYMNPFSGEAQVNGLIPKYTLPTTTLHEMAHQLGYASESEANFIGYLASIYSKDLYFNYSGNVFALRYCLQAIEKYAPEFLEIYQDRINLGVRKNFDESSAFWERHQSGIERVFHRMYDNFLKLNNQEDGMETYSKFIGLLINYKP